VNHLLIKNCENISISGGAGWLIALRFLEGLGEGTTFPALSSLLAAWIPLKERSMLGSFVFGGGQVGTIFGTALSGVLIEYFNGWESVFYFFGGKLKLVRKVNHDNNKQLLFSSRLPLVPYFRNDLLQRSRIASIHQGRRKGLS